MTDRSPANAPVSNDRIPFLYIDTGELKCDVTKCANKIIEKNCKCIKCLDLYCSEHIITHECFRRCRKCFIRDESYDQCNTCIGIYCKEHQTTHKCNKKTTKLLQGDRLEIPEYVKKHKIKIDYYYYYEHQLKKPISQIFELDKTIDNIKILSDIIRKNNNKKNKNQEITKWFKSS